MPGITNPAEAYFKDGLWGWDGSVWRKLPLLWGYSDTLTEHKASTNVSAGDASKNFSVVTSGEIWVIASFVAWSDQANISTIEFYLDDGEDNQLICREVYSTAEVTVKAPVPLYVPPGGRLRVTFKDCALNDDIYATVTGYKMKIEE